MKPSKIDILQEELKNIKGIMCPTDISFYINDKYYQNILEASNVLLSLYRDDNTFDIEIITHDKQRFMGQDSLEITLMSVTQNQNQRNIDKRNELNNMTQKEKEEMTARAVEEFGITH